MENPELTKQKQTEEKPVYIDRKLILQAKENVAKLITSLEELGKKHKLKKSKFAKKALKALKDFVKCNITSDAIGKKYIDAMEILKQNYQRYEANNADQG